MEFEESNGIQVGDQNSQNNKTSKIRKIDSKVTLLGTDSLSVTFNEGDQNGAPGYTFLITTLTILALVSGIGIYSSVTNGSGGSGNDRSPLANSGGTRPPSSPLKASPEPEVTDSAGLSGAPPMDSGKTTGGAAASSLCMGEVLRASGTFTKQKYSIGEKPRITIRVTNTSRQACDLDFGPTAIYLSVQPLASFADTFRSDQCLDNPQPAIKSIPANGHTEHTLEWDGSSGGKGMCGPARGIAGKDHYMATVHFANTRLTGPAELLSIG